MNLLTLLYILCLFVIFTPGIFFSLGKKGSVKSVFIHGLLFTLVVYLSLRFILDKKIIEGNTESHTFVFGSDLVDALRSASVQNDGNNSFGSNGDSNGNNNQDIKNTLTQNHQSDSTIGIGSSVYRFAGLINNLTRRRADGTQINVQENAANTIKFQTQNSAGLLDYDAATGIFTNNTGRTLIAMVSVSVELEIYGVVSGRRQLFLYKNSKRQAVSSAEIGTVGQDGSSLSMTFDIDDGDTIKVVVYYTDSGTVNIGVVGDETQISILCL
jgi:hypothetical protein